MKNVFKKLFNEKEYAFYRTLDKYDDPSYFIMFDQQGKRASVKCERDNLGGWHLSGDTAGLTALTSHECILAITENEKPMAMSIR